jgi:hypothetical protein
MIVAHYTDIETAKIILDQNGLRFSRLPKLNDPYENCQKMPSVGGHLDEMAEVNTSQHLFDQYEIYDNRIRVACFSMPYLSSVNPDFSAALNMPMWTHYAENKKRSVEVCKGSAPGLSTVPVFESKDEQIPGVVLLLNLRTLLKAISKCPFSLIHSGPVKYHYFDSEELRERCQCPAVSGIDIIGQELSKIARKCWFRKSHDWNYERECRVMVYDERACDSFVDIKDSLVGIVTQQQFTANGAAFSWNFTDKSFLNSYRSVHYELFYDPINRYHRVTLNGSELSDYPNSRLSPYYLIPRFPSKS